MAQNVETVQLLRVREEIENEVELERVLGGVVVLVAVHVGGQMVVQEGGQSMIKDEVEDLARLIAEIKEMHRQLLPPMRIERGYEIVGILQDMALEAETEPIRELEVALANKDEEDFQAEEALEAESGDSNE